MGSQGLSAFPAGVKFDPSDEELLQHLKAELGRGNIKSHPLIGNFIAVLDGEDGICQTHPEHLPGVKKDGSSRHFFHRPAKAYTTGTRKRRKIHSEDVEPGVETRWHKTGKTRPVSQDGRILGWKKIMVLYRNNGAKKSKPEKTNWILHQYHLGDTEEETDGELVVCKVFYQKQPRQCTGGRQTEGVVEVENVDTNTGSGEVSLACVSEVTRGTPETPRLGTPYRPQVPRSARLFGNGVFGIGGAPSFSRESELTVLGIDTPPATPVTVNNEAVVQEARSGRFGSGGGNAVHSVLEEFASRWNDPGYEEISTSGRSFQNENDNQVEAMGVSREYESLHDRQFFDGDSQQPFQYNLEDLEWLHCDEDPVPHWFSSEVFSIPEVAGLEEPCITNPNADYPAVDEISTDTPPELDMELMIAQEVEYFCQKQPGSAYLDKDDSESSN